LAKGKEGYKIRTIECVACGMTITGHMREKQKYCSLECYRSSPRPQRKTGEERACEVCGEMTYVHSFRIKKISAFFCSPEHANEWQGRNKDTYNCKICGCEFKWSASRKTQTTPTYCTPVCRDADPSRRDKLIQMNVDQATAKPNKLEIAGYSILDSIGLPYLRQELLFDKFCVDAVYPDRKLVVQFDGDYWHGHPVKFPTPDDRQTRRMWMDRAQDAYFSKVGYDVIRIWESDVKTAPVVVGAMIRKALHDASRTG